MWLNPEQEYTELNIFPSFPQLTDKKKKSVPVNLRRKYHTTIVAKIVYLDILPYLFVTYGQHFGRNFLHNRQ
jgi:hypothetical protein